jgi:nuclear pore complex protein Nup107
LTATVLKGACKTWEDHLWVQVSIICEEKASLELGRIGGSFWEEDGGLEGIERGVREISKIDLQREHAEWEQEAKESLETLKDVSTLEGPGAEHAYHFAQLHIILNKTNELLDKFAGGLAAGHMQRDTFEYAQLCRFFAHLCLFLQLADIQTPAVATQRILEAYLQVLEEAGQRDLIAMYASALGDNAVLRFALYLVSLGLSVDISQRRRTLAGAREFGLDTDRVAILTAERTIEKALEVCMTLSKL